MNIWLAGDIETISFEDTRKTRRLMEKIYEMYKEATSDNIDFKTIASTEIEFLEF